MTNATAAAGGNSARLLDLLRIMRRVRAFEEAAMAAHAAGDIPGPLHVSIGQEAVAAGVCLNLRRDDRITSTHRGHGHALAKGAGVAGMMLELHGRAGGHCGGKGGSMHIADFGAGMLGANGVVAGGIPIAVGAAQGLRLLGSDAVAACFFGDGAINRGPFLEGLNWAALYRLPVLFVCEDNGVAAFTRADSVTAGPGAAARAEALGVPAEGVDGNDAAAVDAAAGRLVREVRAGNGPRLLHARTTRLGGHTNTDAAAWRTPEEVAALRARDPIEALEAVLLRRGVPAESLAAARGEAEAEMRAAREAARAAPWPDPASAWADAQDAGAAGRAAWGVSTGPGHRAFTRMPIGASSSAITWARSITVASEAPYAARPFAPRRPDTEATRRTAPPSPASRMARPAARAMRKLPVTFTSRMRRNRSAGVSSAGMSAAMPAAETAPAKRPGAAAPAIQSSTARSSVTSRAVKDERAGSSAQRARSSAASSRSATATRQPSVSAASATAKPMPDAPPVIASTFSPWPCPPRLFLPRRPVHPRTANRGTQPESGRKTAWEDNGTMQTANTRRSALLAGFGATLAAPWVARAQGQYRPEYKMSVVGNRPIPFAEGAFIWADLVTQRSGGRINVKVYPGSQLVGGDQTRELLAMRQGVIDFAVLSTINIAPQVREASLFQLPFLMPDHRALDALIGGEVGADLFKVLERREVVPLSWGENGFREISNSKRPIRAPGDLRGMKIRFAAGNIFKDIYEALGANPVQMSLADLQPALSTGAVDGQENPINLFLAFRMDTLAQKHLTVWNYVNDPLVFALSKQVWSGFSAADQQLVRECAEQAAKQQIALTRKGLGVPGTDRASLEELQKRGVEVTALSAGEKGAFAAATKPVYDKWAATVGADLVRKAEAAVRSAAA